MGGGGPSFLSIRIYRNTLSNSEFLLRDGRYTLSPLRVLGKAKYSGFRNGRGLFTTASFPSLKNMPPSFIKILVDSSNNSLANSTWDNYSRVLGKLEDCARVTKRRISFPMDEAMVLTFISFLLNSGLKSSSVQKTLSAVRLLHMTHGHPVPVLRPPIVQNILKGRSHFDEERDRYRNKRLPVTLNVLRLILASLKLSQFSSHHQLLVSSVALLAFWGCFRVGELLGQEATKVDPLNDLLKRDVWVTRKLIKGRLTKILHVRLKSSKESRDMFRGVVVEVFEHYGAELCPVAAWERYRDFVGRSNPDAPAFRVRTGNGYRHSRFNNELKAILAPTLRGYGRITAHSFRAGLATLLATAGFDDEVIKAIGRWSSSAFMTYIKLHRVTRVAVAQKLASLY